MAVQYISWIPGGKVVSVSPGDKAAPDGYKFLGKVNPADGVDANHAFVLNAVKHLIHAHGGVAEGTVVSIDGFEPITLDALPS